MFFLTMGYWDYEIFSHFLIVFFWDYGTVGPWDYGTSRPTDKHSVADTTPFRFHFSPFTFSARSAPYLSPFTFHFSVYLSLSAMKAHMSIIDFW